MDNFNPKESEDRSEDEKYTSTKQPNDTKPHGIKRNEGCFDELGRPSSPKRPKNIKHLSAYDQVLDTSRNKKHFPGNIENINFYQIDGFFTLGVENCGSFENFKTEIKEFEKILDE